MRQVARLSRDELFRPRPYGQDIGALVGRSPPPPVPRPPAVSSPERACTPVATPVATPPAAAPAPRPTHRGIREDNGRPAVAFPKPRAASPSMEAVPSMAAVARGRMGEQLREPPPPAARVPKANSAEVKRELTQLDRIRIVERKYLRRMFGSAE